MVRIGHDALKTCMRINGKCSKGFNVDQGASNLLGIRESFCSLGYMEIHISEETQKIRWMQWQIKEAHLGSLVIQRK